MDIEVGQKYLTGGGWPALVIWSRVVDGRRLYWAIHQPGTELETGPFPHLMDGQPLTAFAINEAPSYGQHPARLVSRIIEVPAQTGGAFS